MFIGDITNETIETVKAELQSATGEHREQLERLLGRLILQEAETNAWYEEFTCININHNGED